jgi:hypothetical protein
MKAVIVNNLRNERVSIALITAADGETRLDIVHEQP